MASPPFRCVQPAATTVWVADDWDQRIVNWLLEQSDQDRRRPLQRQDRSAASAGGSEQAKKELSSASSTNISLQYLSVTPEGPIHLDEKLTRAKFEDLTSDLLERTKKPFQDVIKEAGIKVRIFPRSCSWVVPPVCPPWLTW